MFEIEKNARDAARSKSHLSPPAPVAAEMKKLSTVNTSTCKSPYIYCIQHTTGGITAASNPKELRWRFLFFHFFFFRYRHDMI
jgi:hypothetical protein